MLQSECCQHNRAYESSWADLDRRRASVSRVLHLPDLPQPFHLTCTTLSQWLPCRLLIGEAFVDCDSQAALEYINNALDADKALRDQLSADMKALDTRLGELKTVLYARFGKSINLEDPSAQ